MPPIYHVRRQEAQLDLVIKKELEISSDNCKNGDYSYFGMIATNICGIKSLSITDKYYVIDRNLQHHIYLFRLFTRGISTADKKAAVHMYGSLDPKYARSGNV